MNELNLEVSKGMGMDLNKDGNGNWNTTAWDWELLMLVGSQDHSRGFVKSHFATLCALCGFRTNV